jgi:hypothetical protein
MRRRVALGLALLAATAACSVYHQPDPASAPSVSDTTFVVQVKQAESALLATLYPRTPVDFVDRRVVAAALSRFAGEVNALPAPTDQTIAKVALVSAAREQARVVAQRLIIRAAAAARALDAAVGAVDPALPQPYNLGAGPWGLEVQNAEDANLDGVDSAAAYDRLAATIRRTSPPPLLASYREWLVVQAHLIARKLRAGQRVGLPVWELTSAISTIRRPQPHSSQF